MSINKQILIAKPVTLLNAITVTGAGPTFALPTRACVVSWQTSFDVNPSAVNITLRVSNDGLVWTVLDTTTAVGGELRSVSTPFAAMAMDVNVVTNTGTRAATVVAVLKPAVP